MTNIETLQNHLLISLPERTKWHFKDSWVAFDFSRLKADLGPMTSDLIIGGTLSIEWRRYRVFGEERFDNGGAYVCVDEIDGSVRRIDVELERPVGLFNTSVEGFATSFNLFDSFFASCLRDTEHLAKRLRLTDTQAFDAGSHWRLLSDYLR